MQMIITAATFILGLVVMGLINLNQMVEVNSRLESLERFNSTVNWDRINDHGNVLANLASRYPDFYQPDTVWSYYPPVYPETAHWALRNLESEISLLEQEQRAHGFVHASKVSRILPQVGYIAHAYHANRGIIIRSDVDRALFRLSNIPLAGLPAETTWTHHLDLQVRMLGGLGSFISN